MKGKKQLLIAVFLLMAQTTSFAAPLLSVDLASDREWTLAIDGDAKTRRSIKVPGAGWNSDMQEPRIDRLKGVDQYVEYTRKITVPAETATQVTKIEFGAVNYGAEVYLDNELVATHHGPMMPFEADVTDRVSPGGTYELRVKAYHRRHYNGTVPIGFDYQLPHDRDRYNAKFSYGITKYVRLCVYPQVYIKDVFVRPSVSKQQLEYDVWIHNHSTSAEVISLSSSLSGWNELTWSYPDIADAALTIPADSVQRVTVGSIPWKLGPKSYWWPNIPFREDYLAVLHNLNLGIKVQNKTLDSRVQRFGFVEHAEGPFYYTVNGVRVNNISDGTPESAMSEYDCYTTSQAFNTIEGCKESWKRYMRLGFNMNRIHQSSPTPIMMDAADEVGFMLFQETGIRGYEDQRWHPEHLPNACIEMARLTRNHPSTARYSLSNEWQIRTELIDAIIPEDSTRPLVYEVHGNGYGKVQGKLGHAYKYEHYKAYPDKVVGISGLGEYAWGTDKLEEAVSYGKEMRLHDVSYFAPWNWINYWPNFLEGMSHDKHSWVRNNHPDRQDKVDGWGSGLMDWVARSFHPYLIMDLAIEKANPGYADGWPSRVPTYANGANVERHIAVFNNGLAGNSVEVKWEARWGGPDGPIAKKGTTGVFTLEPGFHEKKTISFAIPETSGHQGLLYIVMNNYVGGKLCYTEDRIRINVAKAEAGDPMVTFVRQDDKTQGRWNINYGVEGYEIILKENKIPGYATVLFEPGGRKIAWSETTSDVRALEFFANPPTGEDRIAACFYSDNSLSFSLNVAGPPRQVALYFLDWDKHGRVQTIEVSNARDGRILDTRKLTDFVQGTYLVWNISGDTKFTIRKEEGANAVLSGIFFDTVGSKKASP